VPRERALRPAWIVLPVPQKPRSTYSFFHPHSAPSIGHGFGGIPAPYSFGSSAFPFPPKNSSQTTSKTFCGPPEMQTLALGLALKCPNYRGRNGDSRNVRINSVTIIGFVGADPEQRQTRNNNGSKFTVLSVATQRSWKNTDDEWASKTEWHRVCVFRPRLSRRRLRNLPFEESSQLWTQAQLSSYRCFT
jgi:hypothetical protein